MLQSLAIMYAEHALVGKMKYVKTLISFADKKKRRSPTMYSNRMLGVVEVHVLYSESALDTCKTFTCTGNSINM